MTSAEERLLLKKIYPSKQFADKVNKMSDGQVFAIILRLKLKGIIKT